MSPWSANLLTTGINSVATGIESITKNGGDKKGAVKDVMKSAFRYPIKSIATFLVAPLLAFRVARLAKSPVRRAIATVGLVLSVLMAWAAGTFLGTMTGTLFVLSMYGPLMAFGFLVGTTMSFILGAAFSILVLNFTSWFFLNLSSQDVIDHLKSISE